MHGEPSSTGGMRSEVWARRLEKDPVGMARSLRDALKSMRAVYIDCGKRDEGTSIAARKRFIAR
jgi:hypothetical protein